MEQNELKKLIEEILTLLAVSVESVALTGEGIHPIFLIKTADSGVLIGTNGETLRALNHIIKKMVEKRTGEAAQFLLDVNEYYGRRIQEVKNQAALLGERARVFKTNVEMNPMNSYERMIIHALFTDHPEITTESTGEGKQRRVVLKYKTDGEQKTTDNEFLNSTLDAL